MTEAAPEVPKIWAFTQRTRQITHRLAYAALVSYIAVMATLGFNLWYTAKTDSDSNREWCDLLILLDNPIPPDSSNARAVDAAIKIHTLRVNFGC